LSKRLRNTLSETLPPQSLCYVYNSYDVVGDIAIVRLPEASEEYRLEIADSVMKVHKNVKTVLAQTGAVHGDFRLRRLKFVAGENGTATTHREWGCLFLVDVEKCYFSPRLSYERMRIAKQVGDGEVVLNMFAGAGCFSVLIAKYSNPKKVYSIDVNPSAIGYMQENIRLNRVCGRLSCLLGDAKEIIKRNLRSTADRVLMPLPEKAFEYLPCALSALKNTGGWINYYDFEHGKKKEGAVEKVRLKVFERLQILGAAFDIQFSRIVRAVGPNWYQVVLDIEVFDVGAANDKCGF
jgi:tRNA (guanine37-N1)-methyltransferase